ncbi:FdhF/YdeP family oxidoreductase [Baekduia sp.]|jgi:molybdopterin-dependent oxidoreductase alpha subunit|uniref:FdhF/YdeP family oxidoreductase n=1 Tax=Baekduia sp. TaxID=2600305 RepID=UPI002E0B84CD|nr:FdhF/YdeP family oxidoreductase [Baekduia sp.]
MSSHDVAPAGDEPELEVEAPERTAAGVPAVAYAAKLALQQMGPVRTAQTLRRLNQPQGFDCPGCAWPEPGHPHIAEFCENGAKAVAEEATKARCTPDFFARHSVAELAGQPDFWLGRQGRLTEPMLLDAGATHYRPISWDDALDLVAEELHALDAPDEAVFYTSGRTSNEAAFLYQLLVRTFGTNNLPDCSNMCHESSGSALTETIGIGKGSVTLEDVHAADLIFVVGQNPGTNHPRMLSALEEAKRHGAKIVAVNPLPEAGLLRFKNPQLPRGIVGRGTALADHFLQIRVNGDLALFKAMNKSLLERDALDHAFIDASCEGFEEWAAEIAGLDGDLVAEATGLDAAEIEAVVDLAAISERTIVCWAMGLTQHKNSVATIREIVNFLLLRGNIGREGAGVCPVRGHSNVQGDRTMGIYEQPSPAFLQALGDEFSFTPPAEHGLDVVDAIRAMRAGQTHVFFALGGNFLTAAPDTHATAEGLRAQRLTVQISTKLNRSHLVTGRRALILPTLGRTERDEQATGLQRVSVEDSMGVVHASAGTLAPGSPQLLSEVAIVARLGARLRTAAARQIPWAAFAGDYRLIRAAISRTIPGFEDFETRLDHDGGFALPHPPRDERRFTTPTGRARLTANTLEVVRTPPGRLLLQSIRSHDQYNTTIYGLNDRYRGIKSGRRVVLVHPEDLAALGLADGQTVDLVSEWREEERRAERFRIVAYPTARGCAAAYYPETNPLVPLESTADVSNTPTSKSVVVRLEPV